MKAILSNSIRKLLLFEITKMLAAVLKEFIALFIVISDNFRSLLDKRRDNNNNFFTETAHVNCIGQCLSWHHAVKNLQILFVLLCPCRC